MSTMSYCITSCVVLAMLLMRAEGLFFDCAEEDKCLLSGNKYCGPIPCPYFPCDTPLVYTPGDCCEHCPTENEGPDCQGPKGHIIKYNHSEIIDGKNCTCNQPPGNAICT